MIFNKFSALAIFLIWVTSIVTAYTHERETIGWLEKISITNAEIQLIAKIDTGATTSSIHAEILKKFKNNKDEDWIRFKIKSITGKEIILERKVQRITKIKRKRAPSIRRPVVIIGICIDSIYKEEEINLSNRANYNYPVLIGRNYLSGNFLVDSEVTFTRQPKCSR